MDAIHFGAILVDDIADGSILRKGRTAAHHIYGSSETINRAYLRIFEVVEKCRATKPEAVPFILDNLTQIHKGQDDSLVWRRDGFDLSVNQEQALALYRHCASLKTGALFRLVGQLVTGSHVKDRVLSSFGWYCQLQNDCKNIFSSDVITAKGALAEDLANGEYSYPIIVGLYAGPSTREAVESALHRFGETTPYFHDQVARATVMLQRPEVRGRCLAELAKLREENKDLASLWGRREEMVLDCSRPNKSESDGGVRSLTFWRKVLYAE
ncbi:hypothetical protein OIDMADRAFT_120217 [Oidiodendron maius Zn]|uniref:Uncharacterized protein n=1 Tax=Oidiodendron maius (strain Zn) TaxID=913774 RepID=A0A0C3HLP2_OIDMZ|nr:hypothetical protein OIDMADRAFT_120217 [Oidiodendron maius Zn]